MARFYKATRKRYLDHVRHGMRRGAAAEALGFERYVVDGYIAEHPELEAQVLDAEADAVEAVEEALWQAAVSGNVVACKLWLDRAGRRRSPVAPDPEEPERPAGGGSLGALIDDHLAGG